MSGRAGYRAVIFDVDGVLVDSPHEAAWREALRDLMEGPWADRRSATTWSPEAFTPAVYRTEMSGKPRMDGARAALVHFGVPDADDRVEEYAAHKQTKIEELIDARRFTEYDDALAFLIAVKERGMAVAAASSSKNAGRFLAAIRLDEFAARRGIRASTVTAGQTLHDAFDVDVSGRDLTHGKPHPELFLTAAAELGVDPGDCVVVEDAASGVQAARAGHMAALGVARHDDEDLLRDAGADVVVTSLDAVDLDALDDGRLAAH